MTAENVTGNVVPGSKRRVGKDSTAQRSDAHSLRISRFSAELNEGSSTTSCGNAKSRFGEHAAAVNCLRISFVIVKLPRRPQAVLCCKEWRARPAGPGP